MRLKFDFDHPDHTFGELIAGGWLTPHDPEGNWMYGLDIGTHPDYRQRGIARGLYYARQETVRRLGLTGQLAGGMMIGYGKYKDQMSGEEYFAKMKAGEIYDPTVSTQMRVGFEPAVLIPNYINDPTCGGYGVLIRLLASQEVESE
jgi:GNAT superfamily N-acetyltransferase